MQEALVECVGKAFSGQALTLIISEMGQEDLQILYMLPRAYSVYEPSSEWRSGSSSTCQECLTKHD